MSLFVSDSGGSSIPPLENGSYMAVCVGLCDMGTHDNNFKEGSTQRQCLVTWEIPGETVEVQGKPETRRLSRFYTMSLNEKAKLREHLNAWRGRAFTAEELAKFDLRNIVGTACMLSVIQKTNKNTNKITSTINAVTAVPRGIEKPTPTQEIVIFDLDNPSRDAYVKLPEWVQNNLKESYEAKAGALDAILDFDAALPDFVEAPDDELPF